MRRRLLCLLLILVLTAAGLCAWAFGLARSDPVVRRAAVSLSDWPAGAAPVRVALVSDIHIGNAATGPERLRRIVSQVNALRPDLVILAGDYVAGHEREDARNAGALAELGRLRARLGAVAVLGNHEHWTDAGIIRRVLETAGITVLANEAVRRGPLALGGLDDMVSGHEAVYPTYLAMARVGGARVLVSHSPDIAPWLPRDGVPVLAGHTHCGQVVLPLIGSPINVSHHGSRYLCGVRREPSRTVVVTAGTGTSSLPLRLGAPPDLWLLTLGP